MRVRGTGRRSASPGRHPHPDDDPPRTAGSTALRVVGLLARLGLAAVWLTSGLIKALDPAQTYLAVLAYRVLPAGLTSPVATALPLLEILLGLFLLAGVVTRTVAVASSVLLLILIAGVAQAWARGLAIDCGCFGGGGAVSADQTHYGLEVLRDVGFLVLAGWLIVRPATPWSVDGFLARRAR